MFGEDAAKKSPITDKSMSAWWKTVALQNYISKQISDAQYVLNTAPAQFIENDKAKKMIEAEISKECEAAKLSFLLDQQTGEPSCVAKTPVIKEKAEAKPAPEAKK